MRLAGGGIPFSSEALDDERIGMNGPLTSPIVRTIEASRRAFHGALSRLWDLLQDGSVMEWPDEEPAAEPAPTIFQVPAPKLRLVRNSLDGAPAFKRPPRVR